jgi:hypothetical protein
MAKRIHCHSTHFQVFSNRDVSGNERLDLVTQCVVDGTLTRDRCAASCFGTAASFQQRAAIARGNASQLCCSFTFCERASKPAF